MTGKVSNVLSTFVAWASRQQQALIDCESSFVTELKVGKATINRAAIFSVERFKVMPGGWISDVPVEGGTLTIWADGSAEGIWYDFLIEGDRDLEPVFLKHWEKLDPQTINLAFQSFTARFEGC